VTSPSPFRAKRRRFIGVVSLCVFAALGLIALCAGLFLTHTDTGQTLLRTSLEARVKGSINGKIHIGNISGNFLTGVTIDSVEMRDDEDSLFIATGKVTLRYDPRDLADRRLYFRSVELEHPAVVLRQHENWQWNYRRVFKIRPNTPAAKKGPERGFGDFVVMDSIHIRHGASFRLTIPWHPDDSLHGARRDSAIKANTVRKDHEIRRTREGVTQSYRWTNAYAFVSHARIADPDSAGLRFIIDTLHVDESTPPFKWTNIAGVVRILGDSAWNEVSHFDLPGSTGRAMGKVWWGSDLPVRYDMHIIGDSVSLADVAWVYPTLPTTGSGRMKVDIRNEKELTKIDYVIRDMDVRSTKSHLLGQMTFETGGQVLNVHDVKLTADNVDFDLLRTLNGKPFPADWQGKLNGTVTARGGPLTHFYVDASNLTFNDAHVRNAVSNVQGHGELDILYPAFTAFHGFSAQTSHFDLRTLVAIYPAFPRVTGILSGSAVLDSSWLDVRVSNADLTHTDGPAEPTHATGGGRITYGAFMNYDLTLQASPLSLTTLNVSYPKMMLRGVMYGPIHVKGIAPDLDVTADLTGPAGHLTYAGKVDADSLGSYGAKGAGTFDALEVGKLLGYTSPKTQLSGRYEADFVGDSLANLDGPLFVRLDPSDVDGLKLASGGAKLRFEHGILHVDSLRADGPAGSMNAYGTVGITRSAGNDSLAFSADVDSLGGLRRYLGLAVNPRVKEIAKDSLGGSLTLNGVVRGWADSLDVRSSLDGRNLYVRGDGVHAVSGSLAVRDIREKVTGTLELRADTASASGVRIDEATFAADILDAGHARFALGARGENSATLRAAGDWRGAKDSTIVRLDTVDLGVGPSRWALRRPSRFTQSAAGVTLDTLLFANAGGARIAGFIDAPASAPARARLVADSIPLGDIGLFAQLPSALAGTLSLDLDVAGTSAQPIMSLSAGVRELKYAGLSAQSIEAKGGYGSERASLDANVFRGGRSILDASISYPVALSLFSATATDDSLRGRVHADSIELALIEALSPKIRNSTGLLALDFTLGGRPDDWHVGGHALVKDGGAEVPDAGVKLAKIDGAISIDALRDSLTIDRFSWTSPASNGNASLGGSVVFRDRSNPHLALQFDARNFRAVDKRNLARLDISTGATGLTLTGTPDAATLSGAVNVDRGTIYIPELVRKQLVDLTPEDFAQLFDTTDVRNRSLMPQPPGALVEHLALSGVSVHLGEDVWLRSREANIKLGGSLNVTRTRDEQTTRSTLSRDAKADSARYKLALSGSLSADRGTYTLDLTAVQREFQVQSGRITFFGTPDFNPEIDVTALYQVKQANRADIGIKARIHGNFYPQPALELSSTDAYLSPSDLVSYLVTGRPSFALDATDAQQKALEFVLPTVGASVSRALRDQLGGVVDLFQIQSGAVSDPLDKTANTSQFRSFLSSTRLGGEKQISDRVFLSFSTGLCFTGGSDDPSQSSLTGFAQSIEGKFEYRFPMVAPDRLSLRAGLDPAASALRCGRGVPRGFASTPTQVGFSLFRSWVF
jgi:translocation and assembly module TamB